LEVNGKWVVTSAAKSFSPQETQKLLFKASILFRGTWAEPNCAGGAAGGGGGLGVAEMNMKKCYAAVVPAMIATMGSRYLLMRAPRNQSAPTRRSDTNYSKRLNRWPAAP
jgi:hypothetical protein